ncbi:MAG: BlaI/MecI/CopY family transcriptional regulator [Planctomycetota bacterium]|jgi:predicted transcriptional regulator
MDYKRNTLYKITIVILKGLIMKKLPKISESEWLVMRVLWSKSPLAANEVFEQLDGKTKWKPKTVKTLIDRLMRKGAVRFEKEGRRYRYYPAVAEAECVATETRSKSSNKKRRNRNGISKCARSAIL